jgi:Tfp pilus assembly protein PilP
MKSVMITNFKIKYTFIVLIILIFYTNVYSLESSSRDDSVVNGQSEPYSYKNEGRPDPFRPFVANKANSAPLQDPNEIIEEKKDFFGMQLFEPGQLVLVGIMQGSQNAYAMVEDQSKKGHTLKIGDLVGKRGVVTSIEPQRVIVTETSITRSGKEIKNIVAMKLKKEGDK